MNAAAAIDAYIAEPDAYDPARADVSAVDRERASTATPRCRLPRRRRSSVAATSASRWPRPCPVAGSTCTSSSAPATCSLPPFGEAVGERVADELEAEGVAVHRGTPVKSLVGDDRIEGVALDGAADSVAADLAIVGVGIRPNTELLDGTGVETGEGGAIRTDEYGRTSLPDVYAAGDCATAVHAVTGEEAWMPLGLTANRAGRAVGATIAGDPSPVGGSRAPRSKAFDMEAGRAGLGRGDGPRGRLRPGPRDGDRWLPIGLLLPGRGADRRDARRGPRYTGASHRREHRWPRSRRDPDRHARDRAGG